MAVAPVTIRIGRLIIDGPQTQSEVTVATLRTELTRLVTRGALPHGTGVPSTELRSVTPAGRGREAAARIIGG